MASFFVRSRPTATWSAGAKTLGQKVVSTSSTTGLGVCFEVTTAGTVGGAEPAWNLTVGGTTTDGSVTWTTRGAAGIYIVSKTWALGDRVCKISQTSRTNASSVVWECTTAGAGGGTEPTWPTTITAGTTTQTDSSATWTARACTTWDNANPFMEALLQDTTNATVKVAAGDTIYVSKTHSQSWTPGGFATAAISGPGTIASPCRMLCVDDTGQNGAGSLSVTTGALLHLLNATAQSYSINGYWYCYGIEIQNDCSNGALGCFSSSSTVKAIGCVFEQCKFTIPAGGTSTAAITFGNASSTVQSRIKLIACTLTLQASANLISLSAGKFEMVGGSLIGAGVGSSSSGYMQPSSSVPFGIYNFDGVDFSAVGAHQLMTGSYYAGSMNITFTRCKFASSGSVLTTTSAANIGSAANIVDVINCDFGAGTNYKFHREHGIGTIDQETTHVMTGGASDGTQSVAHKMITNANGTWHTPLEGFDLIAWNDSTSSKTATIEFLTDSASALNNDDIWMELEYLANSGDTQATTANDTKSNILASNAAQPTSTATWATSGISNIMKQKLQITFTAGQKGPVRARVFLAKLSTTVYVDPLLSIA